MTRDEPGLPNSRAGTTSIRPRRRAGTTGRRRAGTTDDGRAGPLVANKILVEPGRNTTAEPGL